MKVMKVNVTRVHVSNLFPVGYCVPGVAEVVNVEIMSVGPTVKAPMYSIRVGETLVRKSQKSLIQLFGLSEELSDSVIGSVVIGTMYDQESINVMWSSKYGLQLRAPGSSVVGVGGKKRFIHSRQFSDRYGFNITDYVHAGIIRIFGEIAGFDMSLSTRHPSPDDDCRTCGAYRKLIASDTTLGDSVEGLELPSSSVGNLTLIGSYQDSWICGLTGKCPATDTIHRANREYVHGDKQEQTDALLKHETSNVAYYCPKYTRRGYRVLPHILEIEHFCTHDVGKDGRKLMIVTIPGGTVRFAYIK